MSQKVACRVDGLAHMPYLKLWWTALICQMASPSAAAALQRRLLRLVREVLKLGGSEQHSAHADCSRSVMSPRRHAQQLFESLLVIVAVDASRGRSSGDGGQGGLAGTVGGVPDPGPAIVAGSQRRDLDHSMRVLDAAESPTIVTLMRFFGLVSIARALVLSLRAGAHGARCPWHLSKGGP